MWQSENCDVCANILYPLSDTSEEETQPIGLWGQRHKQYLKEHKLFLYTTMLLIKGILNSYLADIDRQATEMMFRLVEQMADKEA